MTSVFNGLDRAGSAGYASRAPRQNFQHQFGGLNFGTHSAVIRDAQRRDLQSMADKYLGAVHGG